MKDKTIYQASCTGQNVSSKHLRIFSTPTTCRRLPLTSSGRVLCNQMWKNEPLCLAGSC
jgi:hypothetical protein